MIADLEAAHVTPQPSARIAAIVQASVCDALNGIERRYATYHVDATAPRGASRDAAVASAAYTALVGLIPTQKPLFDQQLATTMAQISDDLADRWPIDSAWPGLGESGGERHPRLAGGRRNQCRAAAVRDRHSAG
jgi:hypothetical protein